MLWKRSHDTIHVEFINAATGAVFAQSNMPVQQLPDTFALNTTMHLGNEDWIVERAEPVTFAEFKRTGNLKLTLRQKLLVDPRDILYSLPTIENVIPQSWPNTRGRAPAFKIAEDDWRQIEFVSLALQPEVDSCLGKIRRVFDEERYGPGFRNLHVRNEIPRPFGELRIGVNELCALLHIGSREYESLGFWSNPNESIYQGFSFSVGGEIQVYGIEDGGRVLAFCVASSNSRSGTATCETLEHFASKHKLCLVDWCQALQVLPDTGQFQRYFESVGTG